MEIPVWIKLLLVIYLFSPHLKTELEVEVPRSTDSTKGSPEATDETKQKEEQPDLKFCTFFNNRAPTAQPDVKNCTWYKEESCCTQIEIEETFKNMKPLQGSTPMCQRYINYLMCYICSPNQFIFYMKQRLTVCEEFCNMILDHCKDASLKGTKIGELYQNGTQFCSSRNLEVKNRSENKCFYFDENDDNTLRGAGYSVKREYHITAVGALLSALTYLSCWNRI